MNDMEINAFASASALDEVGQPVDAFLEVLDADGNHVKWTPNPKYSDGEATSEETAFIATDDAVREVTVH